MSVVSWFKDVSVGQWVAVLWFVLSFLFAARGSMIGLFLLLAPLWWQTYFIIKPKLGGGFRG